MNIAAVFAQLERETIAERIRDNLILLVRTGDAMLGFRYCTEHILSKLLSENYEEETIAVVTHGGMINQLYRAFFKLPIDAEHFFYTAIQAFTSGYSRTAHDVLQKRIIFLISNGHSPSKRDLSFSNARFSILEIYERDIPSCFAISR